MKPLTDENGKIIYTVNSDKRVRKLSAKYNDLIAPWIERLIESEPTLEHLRRISPKWKPPQGKPFHYSKQSDEHLQALQRKREQKQRYRERGISA